MIYRFYLTTTHAIIVYLQYLDIALKIKCPRDQERAYRGLGNSYKCVGNLQQALVCYEKRLVVSHELASPAAKASSYGELGHMHSLLGNFEQAISCMEHQLKITRYYLILITFNRRYSSVNGSGLLVFSHKLSLKGGS